ncbi:MAG: hypothetical protein J0H14_06800 [Alphaproteobacteria bacterium]|nr:hypothetical protein [Alphaproteobacteria bacterium]
MTHVTAGDARTAAAPTTLCTSPDPPRAPTPCHLDRDHLRSGVMARHRTLVELETAMVAACETAAARCAARGVRIEDRASWDRTMWRHYLDAATRLEPQYGPAMRRLYQEIEQLERLLALPLAA